MWGQRGEPLGRPPRDGLFELVSAPHILREGLFESLIVFVHKVENKADGGEAEEELHQRGHEGLEVGEYINPIDGEERECILKIIVVNVRKMNRSAPHVHPLEDGDEGSEDVGHRLNKRISARAGRGNDAAASASSAGPNAGADADALAAEAGDCAEPVGPRALSGAPTIVAIEAGARLLFIVPPAPPSFVVLISSSSIGISHLSGCGIVANNTSPAARAGVGGGMPNRLHNHCGFV